MADLTKEQFKTFIKDYNGSAHQEEALDLLFVTLRDNVKDDQHPWVKKFRDA
jgi:hypothetical protein